MITRAGAMRMAVGVWAVSLFAPVRAEPPATGGDIPPKFVAPTEVNDFVKREVLIPMRDGAHRATAASA